MCLNCVVSARSKIPLQWYILSQSFTMIESHLLSGEWINQLNKINSIGETALDVALDTVFVTRLSMGSIEIKNAENIIKLLLNYGAVVNKQHCVTCNLNHYFACYNIIKEENQSIDQNLSVIYENTGKSNNMNMDNQIVGECISNQNMLDMQDDNMNCSPNTPQSSFEDEIIELPNKRMRTC